jgi:hypothetical protein
MSVAFTPRNLVTYYIDSTAKGLRESDVPLASFDNGCNDAASNAPGIGINTGTHSPSTDSWSQAADDERMQDSQIFGEAASGLNVIDPDHVSGATSLVGFAPTTGVVAIDGDIDIDVDGTGFAIVNRTGAEIPSGVWCWGTANNP